MIKPLDTLIIDEEIRKLCAQFKVSITLNENGKVKMDGSPMAKSLIRRKLEVKKGVLTTDFAEETEVLPLPPKEMEFGSLESEAEYYKKRILSMLFNKRLNAKTLDILLCELELSNHILYLRWGVSDYLKKDDILYLGGELNGEDLHDGRI